MRAAGSPVKSVLAHPGYSATNLQSTGPTGVMKALMAVTNRVVAQGAEQGALPTLYAATVPDLPGGAFIGPDGLAEIRGHPHVVTAGGKAYDEDNWRRLWEDIEACTGVHYEFAGTAVA